MRVFLTPPQVAKKWGVTATKVIGFIEAGELKGVNLASTTNGRPRYRISEEALAEFLESRSAAVVERKPARRQSRRQPAGIKSFV